MAMLHLSEHALQRLHFEPSVAILKGLRADSKPGTEPAMHKYLHGMRPCMNTIDNRHSRANDTTTVLFPDIKYPDNKGVNIKGRKNKAASNLYGILMSNFNTLRLILPNTLSKISENKPSGQIHAQKYLPNIKNEASIKIFFTSE